MNANKNEPLKERPKRDFNDLRKVIMTIKGLDPDAQQLLKEFMDLKFPQERTNYPAMIYQQKQTYLLMCAEHCGLEYDSQGKVSGGLGKPFYDMALFDTITWRSYKGYFADKITEMLKQGTDLSKLITPTIQVGQEKQGLLSRLRNKPSGEQIQE